MKKLISLCLTAIFAVSCASSGPSAGVKVPDYKPAYTYKPTGQPDLKTMADVKGIFGSKASISGKTIDLKGGRIDGSKLKRSSNSQDEDSTGIKLRVDGLTIKNGYIYNIPGGLISYAENTTFDNLWLIKIGEDAISNQKDISKGTRVINCRLYNDSKGDKSLQFNDGRGVEVRRSLIAGGITGIRIQESSAKKQNGKALIYDNVFENLDTAINAAGKTAVHLKGNEFKNVRLNTKTSSDNVKFIND